jgi:hypothetical protein
MSMATFDIQRLREKASGEGEGCEVLEESDVGRVRVGLRTLPQGREELFLEPLILIDDCDARRRIIDWLIASGYTLASEEVERMAFEKRVSEASLPSECEALHAVLRTLPNQSKEGEGR